MADASTTRGITRLRSSDVVARAEATRAALIAAARELFVGEGYFDTTTEQIVKSAGVGTRGALYHHFDDKRALFTAVLRDIEDEMLTSVTDALAPMHSAPALEQVRAGIKVFIGTTLAPGVQRVVLMDGPAVLGWTEWRRIEEEYALGALQEFLRRAVVEHALPEQQVKILSHMLFALIAEAALVIANAEDPRAAQEQASDAVDFLLRGMATAVDG